MGVPKQKWTPDEEAALKAGVDKHGAGKWRTILKDPEFSGVLFIRSNVDLKDKWRNMSAMANGCGSREKNRLVHKRMQPVPKQDEYSMALTTVVNTDEVAIDACPLAVSCVSPPNSLPKRSITRLDNHIIEAITTLKEPGGSNKTNIANFIEEHYSAPPDFKRLLSAELNFLTATQTLIKLKQKYSIAPSSSISDRRVMSVPEARQRATSETDEDDIRITSQAEIDLELEKIRRMSPEAAAEAAARAVQEAEAAIAAAEEAVREADAAEAEAAEAEAYLKQLVKEVAKKNKRNTSSLVARA